MEVLVYDSIYYISLLPVFRIDTSLNLTFQAWKPENEILKFHDFPGFPWPVQTFFTGDNKNCWLFSQAIDHDFSHYFIK